MDYNFLYHTRISNIWNKLGINRRAGVVIPLFSVYSEKSCGIGEITDLKIIADWCQITGMNIIQLLPLNDMGEDFSPYNCISSFALDPIYLNMSCLKNINFDYEKTIETIRKNHPRKFGRVDYGIKKTKIENLKIIYEKNFDSSDPDYKTFCESNINWLKDYARFKILSNKYSTTLWEKWNEDDTYIFEKNYSNEINLIYWIQWQLYEQLRETRKYINSRGIILMGDIPFLVSRNSADVWANRNYFRLDLSAGAPPDMYFAEGQKWGMPPYNWINIAKDNFIYIRSKLNYAGNFYDAYRIDHFIGLFRVWTNPISDNNQKGCYLPQEEHLWEIYGREIIDVMINSSSMLPCAEDLGTVPECSYRVLEEYGIPGMDFQRYLKRNFHFINPHEYRKNSVAVISTHDSSFWINWWQFEAGTIDEKLFEILCESSLLSKKDIKYLKNEIFQKPLYGRLRWKDRVTVEFLSNTFNFSQEIANKLIWLYMESFGEKEKFLDYLEYKDAKYLSNLIEKNLIRINQSTSIFSIQPIQEYLCLDEKLLRRISRYHYRINFPGRINKTNWRITLPLKIEALPHLEINEKIRYILKSTERFNPSR